MAAEIELVSLLFVCGLIVLASAFKGIHETCDPLRIRYSNAGWRVRYNMSVDDLTFVSTKIHYSYYNTPPSEPQIVRTSFALAMLETGYIQPFRRINNTKLINFVHGDTVVIHTIHMHTGDYARTELGFHTKEMIKVVERDYWYAVDVVPHALQDFVVVTMTMAERRDIPFNVVWGKRSILTQKFPKLRDLIYKYTSEENEQTIFEDEEHCL